MCGGGGLRRCVCMCGVVVVVVVLMMMCMSGERGVCLWDWVEDRVVSRACVCVRVWWKGAWAMFVNVGGVCVYGWRGGVALGGERTVHTYVYLTKKGTLARLYRVTFWI